MKIQQESLDLVLALYKPEQRLLRTAAINYPTITGSFLIGHCHYTLDQQLDHATDIEIQLCLNQLAYARVYEAIRLELDADLRGLNFKDLQKEGMLIIESRKRFRKQISTDRIMNGSLTMREKRDYKGVLLCWADFNFENRSCFGSLELAIVTEKNVGVK